MYLSENKLLRLFTLCGLYFAQGVPWGFVAIALKAWLAGEPYHFAESELGDLLAYATLPWSFKWIWGFIVDSYQTSPLGRRRPWLLLAQLAMLVSLGAIALVSNPAEDFDWLLRIVLLTNIFVGLQDVSVDAMAVDLLTDEDRERVSGLMYAASYLGTAVGGAGLGWVLARQGMQSAIACQCLLLGVSFLLPLLVRERPGDQLLPGQTDSARQRRERPAQPKASIIGLVRNVLRAFRLKSTLLAAAVALCAKIGYGITAPFFTSFLRNASNWSVERYATVEAVWGSIAGISACCVGAFAAQRFGAKCVVGVGMGGVGLLWIAMGSAPAVLQVDAIAASALVLQEAFIAFFSTGLFAIYCAVSWPRVAAIQFTAYMALLNASHTIGSKLAGVAAERTTMGQLFMIAGVCQIAIIVGVAMIDLRETRRVLAEE